MLFKRKAYYLLISFLFITQSVSGQDQKVADSLARIYRADTLKGVAKLELLRNLAFNENRDLKQALIYAEELIDLSKQAGNNLYLHRGYFQKGSQKRLLGDLEEALDAFFKSVAAAHAAAFIRGGRKRLRSHCGHLFAFQQSSQCAAVLWQSDLHPPKGPRLH